MHTYETYDTIVYLEKDTPLELMHVNYQIDKNAKKTKLEFDVSPFYSNDISPESMDRFTCKTFSYILANGPRF